MASHTIDHRAEGYARCGCGCWHECDEDGVPYVGCWYQRRELWRRARRKKRL